MFRDIKGRYLRLGIIGDMKGYLGIFRDIKGRYLHLGIIGDMKGYLWIFRDIKGQYLRLVEGAKRKRGPKNIRPLKSLRIP